MSISQFEGSFVEVDCSVLGVYTGVIKNINERDQSVHLTLAAKDGRKLASPDVHIAAADIDNIRFVKVSPTSSSSSSSNSERSSTKSPKTPKPEHNNRLNGRPKSRTLSNRASQRAARDNECFGLSVDDFDMKEDFDFEENLKLFNKKAVFAEIERNNSRNLQNINPNQNNQNVQSNGEIRRNFRHDENVIANSEKVTNRDEKRKLEFSVCKTGSILPPFKRSERDQILSDAIRQGISAESMCEAMARNISNLVLQQNNRNTVVFVLSVEKVSSPINISLCGFRAARQLSGKVKNLSVVCNRKVTNADGILSRELELCKMAGIEIRDAQKSPPATVDLIVGCTLHPYIDLHGKSQSTAVLLVDPPFYSVNLANLIIFPLLPITSSVPARNDPKCHLYIGDLGIPSKLYALQGVDASKLYPSDGFISRIKHA